MKYLYVFLLAFTSSTLIAQNAKSILAQSRKKCIAITSGYIEIATEQKFLTTTDTFKGGSNHLYFKKLPADTFFGYVFNSKAFNNRMYSHSVLYTGADLVFFSKKDSTGTVTSTEKWAEQVKLQRGKYLFYSPLTYKTAFPLPEDSIMAKPINSIEYIGEDKINGKDCYHIKLNQVREASMMGMASQNMTTIYHFWIDKEDMIPLQYSETTSLKLNGEMMNQYTKYTLTKYKLNEEAPDYLFKLETIPSYYQLKDYSPVNKPLLASHSVAPDWNLLSSNNKKLKLSDYKGKVVLIDFSYKSCYPCRMAIPVLNTLYDKYRDKGFEIVAINPYDKNSKEINSFLATAGIKYPMLLDDEAKVANLYQVTGYPTMYLINKEGKIAFVQSGFGDSVEEKIEKKIKELLEQ